MGLSELCLLPLRDLLADRYPAENDIRRILDQLQVPASRLRLNQTPINNWHGALLEIHRRNRVSELLTYLNAEMADVTQFLSDIENKYEAAKKENPELTNQSKDHRKDSFYVFTNLVVFVLFTFVLLWRLAEYTTILDLLGRIWFIFAAIVGFAILLSIRTYKRVYASILRSRKTSGVIVVLVCLLAVVSFIFRTVDIKIIDVENRSAQIRITRNGKTTAVPRNEARFRHIFASFPFRKEEVIISTNGQPKSKRIVPHFFKLSFEVPQDFWAQPIALIRPSSGLMTGAMAMANNMELRISIKSDDGSLKQTIHAPFNGSPIFLGCSTDVEIPKSILEEWKAELDRVGRPDKINNWRIPLFPDPSVTLKKDDTILVELRHRNASDDSGSIESNEFKVNEPHTDKCRPQVMIFGT